MLTLETLPRVKAGCTVETPTQPTDELSRERAHLAQRAADVLGYKALKAHQNGSKTLTATSGPLTEGLLKLDISILDTASVITYQLEELTRRNREVIEEQFKQYTTGWFNFGRWEHTALTSYQQPIPEFVLDKAIRIKEAVPEVQFFIQHLNDPKADPFLIAHVNDEIYYIEAWDEPRFESTM